MKQRQICSILFILAIFTILQSSIDAKPILRCKTDGSFKIVMLSDIQEGSKMDPKTTSIMEGVLDIEKPDLVIIAGDCIAGYDNNCQSVDLAKQAISHVAYPMEKRGIPWAIAFGNHDTEHNQSFKFTKEDMIRIYAGYTYNLNTRGPKNIHGVGNSYLLINDSSDKQPVFDVWLLDSGMYQSKEVSDLLKSAQKSGAYDWIHTDQVIWYYQASEKLEKKYQHKIPGLMFFHIPLIEFQEMADHTKLQGDKFEGIASSDINSGLLAAVLDRGDVKGIFCGHDHINNFIGQWAGVALGYDASLTHESYNLPDSNPNHVRTRGGRVFVINQSDPSHFMTWMRYSDGNKSDVYKSGD